MAIYTKNNAVGVDAVINTYIQRINAYLNVKKLWNIDIYHKIYREMTDQGVYAPYSFVSVKDYKEVFLNDKVNGECGFYLNQKRDVKGNLVTVSCDVIFSINIDKIDGSSLQREDEKAIMIALAAVEECEEVTSIKTGINNVFADFDTDRIKYRDLQPFLNFSFTININFKNNKCYVMY